MKKKGSKKKVNSNKISSNKISSDEKRKGFFWFLKGNKVAPVVLAFVFLALVILLPFFTTGNAVNVSITGQANALDEPVSWGWLNSVRWLGLEQPLTLKEFIVFVITLLIIFAMLFDILSITSIFSPWVSAVISGGMAIIASLIGFVRAISVWFITIGSIMGIAAGFLEIGVAIVVFVGLVFASQPIARFAARRKAQAEEIRAIGGAGKVKAAVRGLRIIEKGLRSKKD